jgi:peptidyl-tRNA hydrolase
MALVQAILVAKSGSHEEMIEAVARASLQAYREGQGEQWQAWLAGRFTKSVRRTGRDLAQLQAQLGGALVRVGEAAALALVPMSYEEMPKSVREGQVAATVRPASGAWPHDRRGLRLWLNADLEMSTGKAAAQVAHGLLGWWLQASEAEKEQWVAGGEGLWLEAVGASELAAKQGSVAINDAGWTEIEAGSLTVKALGLDSGPDGPSV